MMTTFNWGLWVIFPFQRRVGRYLCLERSIIHSYTFHSLRFPTSHFKHVGQCLCCSGSGQARTPKGHLSWMDPYVFPRYPSVSMQNYAHGKIYTGRTFILYRSSDIAIVACKRNITFSDLIGMICSVETTFQRTFWGFDFKISYFPYLNILK